MGTSLHSGKSEAIRRIRALASQPPRTREELSKWYAEVAALYAVMKQHRGMLSDMPHFIGHYLSDADIRLRDPEHAAMQERELEAALTEWEAQGDV